MISCPMGRLAMSVETFLVVTVAGGVLPTLHNAQDRPRNTELSGLKCSLQTTALL